MSQPPALRRSTLAVLFRGLTAASFGIGGTPLTAPAHAADVFVAPTGNDSADGTAEKPMATLRRALDRVRAIRVAEPARDSPIEVELADARYELAQTVEIAGEDSGTERSPTVFLAFPWSFFFFSSFALSFARARSLHRRAYRLKTSVIASISCSAWNMALAAACCCCSCW